MWLSYLSKRLSNIYDVLCPYQNAWRSGGHSALSSPCALHLLFLLPEVLSTWQTPILSSRHSTGIPSLLCESALDLSPLFLHKIITFFSLFLISIYSSVGKKNICSTFSSSMIGELWIKLKRESLIREKACVSLLMLIFLRAWGLCRKEVKT